MEMDPGIPSAIPDGLNRLEVRMYFVRGRNALVARADFGALYEDYYLHWLQHGIRLDRQDDDLLKDALAAFTLSLASRPLDESLAWTLNLQDPLMNLFVAGDNRPGRVVGRVWVDGVREGKGGMFFEDTRRGSAPMRRSMVDLDRSCGIFSAAETFHERSEQIPTRYFRHGPEDIVRVSAQPDCDADWLRNLDEESVRALDKLEELALLETRHFVYSCGCDSSLVAARLALLCKADRDHLFETSNEVRAHCPRCGAVFQITRAMLEEMAE